jgi:hypothetical protein
MALRGYVDLCQQWQVAGWAAEDGRRTAASIRLNGVTLTSNPPVVHRPDLATHGIDEQAGFRLFFTEPLTESDVVEVLFEDGSHLTGSPCVSHQHRLRELLDGIRPEMHGLEIGPLDRPVLTKKTWNVWHVDHASREDLIRKYTWSATEETLYPDRIVPVDIIWAGRPLTSCVPEGLRFDYCIASHVMEHVPDIIGWLQQLACVLRDGGIVSLAIPDKERTFDHARATSRPADLVEAHIRRLSAPSPRHVFDHITSVSPYGAPVQPASPELIHEALQHAIAAETAGRYLDVHCYVFTQRSFLEAFEVIAHTGLLPFRLRRFFPTRPDANEFIVSLEKCSETPASIAATYKWPVSDPSPNTGVK